MTPRIRNSVVEGRSYWDQLDGRNGGAGIDIREFHPEVIGVKSVMNQLVGIQVIDSSNVKIEHANTSFNGQGAPLNLEQVSSRSNDVVSSGKDVMCLECRSTEDRSEVLHNRLHGSSTQEHQCIRPFLG